MWNNTNNINSNSFKYRISRLICVDRLRLTDRHACEIIGFMVLLRTLKMNKISQDMAPRNAQGTKFHRKSFTL